MNDSSMLAGRGQGEPCHQTVSIFQPARVDVLNKSDITAWILSPATADTFSHNLQRKRSFASRRFTSNGSTANRHNQASPMFNV